ncbi:LOW QUALITY PROTEIN: reverse transcriptase, partial [Phytophthora megakarya]
MGGEIRGSGSISAVTTRSKAISGVRSGSNPLVLCEEVIRELRIERIQQAQDEEAWIHNLKKYLVGEIHDLTQEEARSCGSIATNYEVDQHDLLFYCPTMKESAADRDKLMRL